MQSQSLHPPSTRRLGATVLARRACLPLLACLVAACSVSNEPLRSHQERSSADIGQAELKQAIVVPPDIPPPPPLESLPPKATTLEPVTFVAPKPRAKVDRWTLRYRAREMRESMISSMTAGPALDVDNAARARPTALVVEPGTDGPKPTAQTSVDDPP